MPLTKSGKISSQEKVWLYDVKIETLPSTDTAQKMKFFNKDFFNNFDQNFWRNP